MLSKQELNEKLELIYPLSEADMCEDNQIPLIQDSWRMFELAVDNDLRIRQADESAEIFYYSFDEKEQEGRWISVSAKHKDHESKVAAARYAIAMALVKLAESKNVE